MAIFNLYTRKYLAIRKPYVMRQRLLLTINWKFAVAFFARGLHTRTAIARLPLRQLGFLVLFGHDVVTSGSSVTADTYEYFLPIQLQLRCFCFYAYGRCY